MPDTPRNVLEHIADLLSNEPFKDYFNAVRMNEDQDYVLMNAETGEVFIIRVDVGWVRRV